MPPHVQNNSSRRNAVELAKGDSLTFKPETNDHHWRVKKNLWTLEVKELKDGVDKRLEPIQLSLYDKVFKDEALNERPETLNILQLKPIKLDALGRPGRRRTVVALAEGKSIISLFWTRPITDRNVAVYKRRPKFTAEEKPCDFATATIIALALHCMKDKEDEEDKEARRMVSELLALSLPSTMQSFRTFCKSPFMRFSDIPNFVHVVARNVAHDDEGGADRPIEALRTAANIVADIIADNVNTTDLSEKKESMVKRWAPYASIFKTCLQGWSNDKDRGIQVGLVLAGIKAYFETAKEDKSNKYDIAFFLIDVLLSGLTNVPVGGFAFGIGQSIASALGIKMKDRALATIDQMYQLILDAYYEAVEFPLHRDSHVDPDTHLVMSRLGRNGGNDGYVVKVEEFTRWVNLVMKYLNLAQI